MSGDMREALDQEIAENERLRALLRRALPFVNDAGTDECPEASSAAVELANELRALGIVQLDNRWKDARPAQEKGG